MTRRIVRSKDKTAAIEAQRFQQWMVEKTSLSPRTQDPYLRVYKKMLQLGLTPQGYIDHKIREWRDADAGGETPTEKRRRKGANDVLEIPQGTMSQWLGAARKVYFYLQRVREVPEAKLGPYPMTEARVMRQQAEAPESMSREQLEEYLRTVVATPTIPRSVKAMLALLPLTGLRPMEMVSLKRADLVVHKGQKCLRVIGKRNKQRVVPLNKRALAILTRYMAKTVTRSVWMFPSLKDDRKPGSTAWLRSHYNTVRSQLDWAGGLTLYATRHTFATLLREAGVSLDDIRDLMGHESLDTTRLYDHGIKNKVAAVDKL